jgi:hypothetical protein
MEYINKIIGVGDILKFVPGMGSGTLDSVIQLYYSWGKNYIILMDSDNAGEAQKKRYLDKFGAIVRDRIFTLGEIDSKWKNKAMESLFEGNDAIDIQRSVFSDNTMVNKSRFNLSIQELLINSSIFAISKETKENFEKVIDFLSNKIKI